MAHHAWKGEAVGYSKLHAWVARWLGKPQMCAQCGTEAAKRYEWANLSHNYLRDFDDWIRLCVGCHRQFDSVKDYCKWGHEFTPANTYIWPKTGDRRCRTCDKNREAKRPLRTKNKES